MMAPIFRLASLALFSSVAFAVTRPRPKYTNGIDDPTDSPDDTNTPTVTESQDPGVTSIVTDGGDVITSINYPGTTRGVVSTTENQGTSRGVATRITTRTSRTSSQTACPTDQASYFYLRRNYCCPGSFYGLGAEALCGISCTKDSTGPTAIVPSDLSCSTSVLITEDNYDSKVAAATAQAGTTSSPGAAAMITAGPMVGVLAVAGGILLAV